MSSRGATPLARSWGEQLAPDAMSPNAPSWLGPLQARAVEAFRASGLPGNKDEPWKYTSLRRLESLAPDLRVAAEPSTEPFPDPPLPGLKGFGFRWAEGRLEWLGAPPEGVSLRSLEDALADPDPHISVRLQRLFESMEVSGRSRAFEALNTALLGPGVVLHVAAGVDAGTVLAHWALPRGLDAGLDSVRFCVLLDRGAKLQLVEQYGTADSPHAVGTDKAAQALNLVLQADLGEDAALEHLRLQNGAQDDVLLTFSDVRQGARSRYRHFGFDLGGGLVRHAIDSALEGEAAEAAVLGAFLTDADRLVDYHVAIDHRAPATASEQLFRGVLGGHSRGVFNGKAVIRPGADGSSVRQSNANLLLSRDAEMDTKPELEIYADEVEASHGATVGQLDETAVFYLRSRGIGEADARRMLTTAFCRAVAGRMADARLSAAVADLLEAAMPQVTIGGAAPAEPGSE